MSMNEKTATGDDMKAAVRSGAEKSRVPAVRKKATIAKTVRKVETKAAADTKPAATDAPAKPVAVKKTLAKTRGTKPVLAPEARQRMIGEAAYLISQRRDPAVGSPETDWISAETVIDMIFDVA